MVETSGQDGPRSNDSEQVFESSSGQDPVVINSPAPGQEISIPVGDTERLQLRFDPLTVQVAQSDGDLLLQFPNGGQLALRDFSKEDSPPDLILPDGSPVDGEALLKQLEELISLPPLETAAGPAAPTGSGGGSVYQSNLGELIAGLQSGAGATETGFASNVGTPGGGTAPLADDDGEVFPTVESEDSPPVLSFAQTFVPPANPVGPGADQSLFTKKSDSVDLNAIDVGGYQDGTQYDAGKGNDIVILADDSRQAIEAGFVEGTEFDAGRGHDLVTGGSLADLVDGGRGNDTLLGGIGDDSLFGAQGNDSLVGGVDDDLLHGGGNNDILLGGVGDDTLIGGSGRDTLEGGDGKDLLNGGSSHDLLKGDAGADTLMGAGGRDTLEGGSGNDLLLGGSGNDSLLGGADNDQLFGSHGRDTLDGGLGDDFLNGGGSNDLLLGGLGDDTLLGGSGRDTLDGGLGDDVMAGGNGRDVFSFSLAENQGDDVILDFRTGNNGDRLELSDLLNVNGDGTIDIADLDAGGHNVSGTADSVVITFEQGGSLTLEGLDGSSVDSFQDLLDIKVNIDIS
ncbi:calcium-binding protein [Pelagibius litoralis]|uniref:Calcium-binding protein n=1 Tax=Pelagibius litoralis TaxID=374515 RepID=A0A967F0J1_9PROT|nr:calcium-binding protein [Pelagibius litoralis]NIA70850.1 calcium-binding protein [Pelagibius litoralis]